MVRPWLTVPAGGGVLLLLLLYFVSVPGKGKRSGTAVVSRCSVARTIGRALFLFSKLFFSFSFEIKLISFQHLGTPELVRRRHVVTQEAGQEEDVDEEQGRHEQHLSGKDIRPESHPRNVFLTLF